MKILETHVYSVTEGAEVEFIKNTENIWLCRNIIMAYDVDYNTIFASKNI